MRALLLIAVAAMIGCGEPPLMSEEHPLELDGWHAKDSVQFEWSVQDSTVRHDLIMDVRHRQTYPYANLYLFLTYQFPNGKSRIDTIECMLADERGRWRGTGFGDLVDQRFMVESGVRFPLSGRYRLDVTHGMRQDPMPGLASVGLRLEAHRP